MKGYDGSVSSDDVIGLGGRALVKFDEWAVHSVTVLSIAAFILVAMSPDFASPSKDSGLSLDAPVALGIALVVWLVGFGAFWKIRPLRDGVRSFFGRPATTLTPEQKSLLAAAVGEGFSIEGLDSLLRFWLGESVERFLDNQGNIQSRRLVEVAENEGWLNSLAEAVRSSSPDNPKLVALLRSAGVSGITQSRDQLESVVRASVRFDEVDEFAAHLTAHFPRVCRISYPGGGAGTMSGTGFLIGPDLVLTNYHVVKNLHEGLTTPDAVSCLFDYKKNLDGSISQGTVARLNHPRWLESFSPLATGGGDPDENELDYALIRLAERIGEKPIGAKAEPGAAARGWIEVRSDPVAIAAGTIALIVQHPNGEPKKLSLGVTGPFNANGTRMKHNVNTLGGSSGSPVFSADLKVIALHVAGDKNFDPYDSIPDYNQAIPIHRIVESARSNGSTKFWVDA